MMSTERTIILPTIYPASTLKTDALAEYDNPNTITLVFHSGILRLNLEVGQEIVLGRTHPSNILSPEVDLTAYDGLASGISRLHAAIKRDQTGWYLTDLNSSNGTWVNGKRLAPYVAQSLVEVNHLQLGRLDLKIKLPADRRLL